MTRLTATIAAVLLIAMTAAAQDTTKTNRVKFGIGISPMLTTGSTFSLAGKKVDYEPEFGVRSEIYIKADVVKWAIFFESTSYTTSATTGYYGTSKMTDTRMIWGTTFALEF